MSDSTSVTPSTDFSSRYKLGKQIGVGGIGVVYEAEDLILMKKVALKILLPHAHSEAIIRFHREAKMAARLNHNN
ncbi:MAG: serine/threonine protein kinase, partial [Cyanobacteria bacterium]|nr:serine/threonine protein kinase [Cyanobacteriota bacterium]